MSYCVFYHLSYSEVPLVYDPSLVGSFVRLPIVLFKSFFGIFCRTGRSSIQDSWANSVIWHQGWLFLVVQLTFDSS